MSIARGQRSADSAVRYTCMRCPARLAGRPLATPRGPTIDGRLANARFRVERTGAAWTIVHATCTETLGSTRDARSGANARSDGNAFARGNALVIVCLRSRMLGTPCAASQRPGHVVERAPEQTHRRTDRRRRRSAGTNGTCSALREVPFNVVDQKARSGVIVDQRERHQTQRAVRWPNLPSSWMNS